jgi:hypothetical protein
MCTTGLDLHKRESQLCIRMADGEVIERRIATTRARFTEVVGPSALGVCSSRRRQRVSGWRDISRRSGMR